jgi:hypothetical protein
MIGGEHWFFNCEGVKNVFLRERGTNKKVVLKCEQSVHSYGYLLYFGVLLTLKSFHVAVYECLTDKTVCRQ